MGLMFGVPPTIFSTFTGFCGIYNFVNTISNNLKENDMNGTNNNIWNKVLVKTGVATKG